MLLAPASYRDYLLPTKKLPVAFAIFSILILVSSAQTAGQKKLEPGQYEWDPERSPSGPLLVVCSIDDQMLYAYRNGIQITRSTVSIGRKGKTTPTGVFTILQRKIDHESSI